ncbi:MAG: tetratricopeptide repeat protein, partial [Planctomycetota bacterium]|nr:tetratricopeptide repeat protein [Planctomycetota bacterium]
LFIPLELSPAYARTPQHVIEQGMLYFLWIIPVTIGISLWYLRKRIPLVVLGSGLFLLGFLPVSGLKEFHFQDWSTVADRYMYLSMLGVALAFGSIASTMNRKWQWGLFGGLLLLLGGRSAFVQVPVWKDRIQLWSHAIKVTPEASKAYKNRGTAYLEKKKFQNAIIDFDRALQIKPEFAEAFYARGLAYLKMENLEAAMTDLNSSLKYRPHYPEAFVNRGVVYNKKGEREKAFTNFDKALSLDPYNVEALNNRGALYSQKNEPDKAMTDFTEAIRIAPQFANPYRNRGIIFYHQKEFKKALADWKKAQHYGARLDPIFLKELEEKARK